MTRAAATDPVYVPPTPDRGDLVREYLEQMDNALIHRDGSCELSHDEAKAALRDCYLIATGEQPKTQW